MLGLNENSIPPNFVLLEKLQLPLMKLPVYYQNWKDEEGFSAIYFYVDTRMQLIIRSQAQVNKMISTQLFVNSKQVME